MNENSFFDVELKALEDKATGRLLMADVWDETAFSDLYAYICSKAEQLKADNLVSKQLLATILHASSAIRSRADYLPLVRARVELAVDFDMVLALIAIGEAPKDRTPGRPRIY